MSGTGRLIVFEGTDGAGKSSLCEKFAFALHECGVAARLLAFPGNEKGALGELVYRIHHDAKGLGIRPPTPTSLQTLHIAAHLDALETAIIPALERGESIILDRYWWSTWIYGKVGGMRREVLDALIEVERLAWWKWQPSLVFYVTRAAPLRDEPLEKWHRLKATYEELIEAEHGKYPIHLLHNDGAFERTLEEVLPVPVRLSVMRTMQRPNDSDDGQKWLFLGGAARRSVPKEPDFSFLRPLKATVVFATYWRFAAERQRVFMRRLKGEPPPWTNDAVLKEHKFTNAYRASDRVSQYLIKHVIYAGDQIPCELFFRIILFKLFNRIETWELLTSKLGEVRFTDFRFDRYDNILSSAHSAGKCIYSAAYIMPSGGRQSGFTRKHQMHLRLVEKMVLDGLPSRLADTSKMADAFSAIRAYPTIGDFLAYQYITDLNYSTLTNFNEMEFVMPGPGARDGIRKCFSDLGGLTEAEVVKFITERQEECFREVGVEFPTLWGRRLQLIDCQNLFCEVDKYARIVHPEFRGHTGRTRIKQKLRPSSKPLERWYPPKWGINDKLNAEPLYVPNVRS